MLTAKQHDLLMFIHQRLKETGIPPSFEEMKDALDLRSKSGIHRLISALEERGFIRKLPNRARALEVIKLPESLTPSLTQPRAHGFSLAVIQGRSGEGNETAQSENKAATTLNARHRKDRLRSERALLSADAAVGIPVMGRIAAGVPIEAIQTQSHLISLPVEMLGPGDHYALEVCGDSMIEAGILDGDTAVIKKTEAADNGDIVVALVDNEEATLKRLRRKGHSIALEAANPAYKTRIFGPDQIQVQGRLIGLLRRY